MNSKNKADKNAQNVLTKTRRSLSVLRVSMMPASQDLNTLMEGDMLSADNRMK